MIQREPRISKALKWIGGEIKNNPSTDKVSLIDRASQQFNLSPLQGEFLCRNLLQSEDITADTVPVPFGQ